jgi:hypothetical protein
MELKGPSHAEIKKFIRMETNLEFITLSSQHFRGYLLWADDTAFHIKLDIGKTITLLKHSIVYYAAI